MVILTIVNANEYSSKFKKMECFYLNFARDGHAPLPRHALAFHAAALDTVIHAQLGPGHEEKQEMR